MPRHQRHEADQRRRRRARQRRPSTAASTAGNFFGEVGLADFHDLADRVPADVKTQIDELTEQVLSGEVPTGYQP